MKQEHSERVELKRTNSNVILPLTQALVWVSTRLLSWKRFTGFVDIFEYTFDIAIIFKTTREFIIPATNSLEYRVVLYGCRLSKLQTTASLHFR